MFVPFSQLPSHARIWIYQANRDLQAAETGAIEQKAQEFAKQWSAHKVQLQASASVFYNSFLILGIDEHTAGASGCSIDSSVNFIRELEKEFTVQFLDRTQLAFYQEDNVIRVPLQDIKNKVANGEITAGTLFFNNLVQSKSDLEKAWLLPASNTWLAKYFASTII